MDPRKSKAGQPFPRQLFHIAVGTDISANNPIEQLSEGSSVPSSNPPVHGLHDKTMSLLITPLTPPPTATGSRSEQGPWTMLTLSPGRFSGRFSDLTTDPLTKAAGILSPPSPSSGSLAPSASLNSGPRAPSPSLNSGPLAPSKNTRSSKRSPRKPAKLLENNLPEKAAPAKARPVSAKKEAVVKKKPKKRVQKAKGTNYPKKRQRGAAAALAAAAGISPEAIEERARVIVDKMPEAPRGMSESKAQKTPYRAQIWKGGRVVYLGVFKTKREACIRYDLEVIRTRHPKKWTLNFHINNYPNEVKAAMKALEEKEKNLEEKQEAAKPKRKPKTKRQPKSSVATAASPLPLAPAPATTAKPTRHRARKQPKQQGTNKAGPKQGSSDYKGVSWSHHSSKWRSQIWIKGAGIQHIGFYNKEIDAASAYDLSSLEFHGPQEQTHNMGMQLTMKDLESFSYFRDPKTRASIAASRKKDNEATEGAMLLKYASDLHHRRFCLKRMTPCAGPGWRSLMMKMKQSYF